MHIWIDEKRLKLEDMVLSLVIGASFCAPRAAGPF
jgi:hypothetical protein